MDAARLNFLFDKLSKEKWFARSNSVVEVGHVPVVDVHDVSVVPAGMPAGSAVVPASPAGLDSMVPSGDFAYDVEHPSQEVIDYVLSKRPSECTPDERLIRKRAMNRKAASVSRKRKRVQNAGIKTRAEELGRRCSNLEHSLRETLAANERMVAQLASFRRVVEMSPALAEIVQQLGGPEASAIIQAPADDFLLNDDLSATLARVTTTPSDSESDWLDDADLDCPPAKRFCP